MKEIVNHFVAAYVTTLLLALAACNTVEGVGQDVNSAGRAVERSADNAK